MKIEFLSVNTALYAQISYHSRFQIKTLQASSQIPPGSPVIDGPPVIVFNSQITLTCTSSRGQPTPTVRWFKDDTEITTGISTTTSGTAVTTSLTFTATKDYHLEVVECQAENGVLQNPLTTTKYMEVHFSPESPTLTGPTTLTPGQQGIWTCVSANGYPAGVMSMRNENKNTQFTTEFTSNSVLDQKSYDVTGTLIWSPVIVNNGDTICCDVTHTTTSTTPQKICRIITVSQPIAINAPVNQYTPTLQTTLTLLCDVTQGTASQIIWIKDNQSDGGNYVCRGIDAVTGNIVNTDTINVNPVGTPPITSIPQPSYTQISGQQIILGCTVNSPNSPLQEVQWTFTNNQGQTTDPISISNSNGKYSGSSVNSPSLTINSVASTDQGVYSCKARNSVGTSTNNPTTSLTVTGSVPVVQINPSTYTATYGSQVVINCNIVSASPAATQVYWQRSSNNQILRIDNGDQGYQGSTTSTPSLIINFVNTANAGVYTCFASNAVGTGTSNLGTVKVTGGVPVVQINPSTYTATYGSQVVINCNIVSASPAATQVYWQRSSNNQILRIDNGDQGYEGSTTSTPSLIINFVNTANAGVYTCFASNAVGTGTSNLGTVKVTGGVPVVQINPSTYTATYGSQVVINCNIVSASPAATQVYWQRSSNNQILRIDNGDQGYEGSTTSTPSLIINFVNTANAGVYTCFASNAVGTGTSNLGTVKVTGAVPTTNVEPRQYTATVGDASFQIQCLVTATPGATSWYWTFQPVGGSQQTIAQGTNDNQYTVDNSGTNPHLTIKSIALNEAGIYTCYATNAAGTSDSANNPSGLDITVSRSTYSAIAGDSIVTILCKINGTPPAIAWEWTKTSIAGGNLEIISQGKNNARRQVVSSETKPNLNIYSITENDEGIYRCRASNREQQYISDPITLKVQEESLRKVPGEPQTNNTLEIEEGKTVILSCSSFGGNPAPSVVWLKDNILTSTGTNSSVFGNVTTTTLTFVATSHDNLEVYECQADNGFLQRPLVKTTYLVFSSSNKPPGQPMITGSQRYDLGDTVTLSCSSTGGNPLPTVNWLRDDNVITTGISRFSGSEVTRTTLTFVAGLEDHLEVFECQAHNDYLQNPLASTTYIELYFAPRVPTLTGPSTLISGSSGKWTCSAANGYPAPTLSMRIQDRQYTNEITVLQSYDIIDKSYTVAGTLNLVPSIDKTGQDLCCDVIYLFGNNDPQSTCLQLTINDEDEDNIIIYVVIGILAMVVLFVVLLVVMIRHRRGMFTKFLLYIFTINNMIAYYHILKETLFYLIF
ncbi:HMCN [Mytilus edulis]|uniref:HMCN n=1 Tax=Mytilus edulis TaxID=6550 RepID=A0A8S3QL25_MYTED|nr:HMCN [Mytilus edulis]